MAFSTMSSKVKTFLDLLVLEFQNHKAAATLYFISALMVVVSSAMLSLSYATNLYKFDPLVNFERDSFYVRTGLGLFSIMFIIVLFAGLALSVYAMLRWAKAKSAKRFVKEVVIYYIAVFIFTFGLFFVLAIPSFVLGGIVSDYLQPSSQSLAAALLLSALTIPGFLFASYIIALGARLVVEGKFSTRMPWIVTLITCAAMGLSAAALVPLLTAGGAFNPLGDQVNVGLTLASYALSSLLQVMVFAVSIASYRLYKQHDLKNNKDAKSLVYIAAAIVLVLTAGSVGFATNVVQDEVFTTFHAEEFQAPQIETDPEAVTLLAGQYEIIASFRPSFIDVDEDFTMTDEEFEAAVVARSDEIEFGRQQGDFLPAAYIFNPDGTFHVQNPMFEDESGTFEVQFASISDLSDYEKVHLYQINDRTGHDFLHVILHFDPGLGFTEEELNDTRDWGSLDLWEEIYVSIVSEEDVMIYSPLMQETLFASLVH